MVVKQDAEAEMGGEGANESDGISAQAQVMEKGVQQALPSFAPQSGDEVKDAGKAAWPGM